MTSSGHCNIIVQRNPNIKIFHEQAERRSFFFFQDRTASQLAGLFASDFWDCLLPLSAHYHPAIRHAVVALAALHERFENDDNSILSSNYDIAQGGFALQQYNRAIGCLIKPVKDGGDQRLDVALITCILFACFEVFHPVVAAFRAYGLEAYKCAHCQQTLRGHYGSAISHVQNGVKIISSIKETLDPQPQKSLSLEAPSQFCVPLETLQVMFARLDYQSIQAGQSQLRVVLVHDNDTVIARRWESDATRTRSWVMSARLWSLHSCLLHFLGRASELVVLPT